MIFYEKKYAEELLEKGFTSFMSFNDLSTLAKYFKYLGKNKSQIREDLIKFCKKYNPDFNEILSWNKIKGAVKSIDKSKLRIPSDIIVTESELDTIKNIGGYKHQRIAFVILVIAKYRKYNSKWIKSYKDSIYADNFYTERETNVSEILKFAKVKATRDEFTKIMVDFHGDDFGLITSTGTQSFQINFIDEDSPIAIIVTDMDRIGDFYPYFCEN